MASHKKTEAEKFDATVRKVLSISHKGQANWVRPSGENTQ